MVVYSEDLSKQVINFLVMYMLGIFGVLISISLISMYMEYIPEPIPLDYDYVSIYQQLAC